MQKPASMKRFDFLFLGSIVVGLLGLFFSWDGLIDQMNAEFVGQGLEPDSGMAATAIIGGVIFATALNLALWFLISVLRIEFVKWVLIAMVAWGMYTMLIGMAAADFGIVQAIGLVSTILSIAAIYMLFQPDAKEWFAAKRGD